MAKKDGVNRKDLVEKLAKVTETKAAAEKALTAFIDAVTDALKKGQKVTLVGFGTFSVGSRKARTGRNPQTGATIRIKASKVPRFKAGADLKKAVNR
jgi:DNA-binding protein HU-beta